jgi:hypothetical protein
MVSEDEVTNTQFRVGGPRAAFHVQRPLSDVLVVGYVLTEGDVAEIKEGMGGSPTIENRNRF